VEASDRGRRMGELGVQPARLKSSSPALAGRIRSASLPWEGRPLVRLDDEQGAFALSMAVLGELGLRAELA
jgi:hypothetical protein